MLAPSLDEVAARVARLGKLHRHRSHSPDWLHQELTFSQVRLLFALREGGPRPMSRLATMLGVTPATASGMIDRIERRGLAERRHRGDDRRVVECVLTERGNELLRALTEAHVESIKQLLALFTPDELAEFDRLLTIVFERSAPETDDDQATETG